MSISTGNSSNDSPGSSRYSLSGHSSRLSSHAMAPRDVILTFSRHPGLPQAENTLAPPDGNRSTSPADPSEYRSHIRYPSRASTSVGRMILTTRAVIPTPGFSGCLDSCIRFGGIGSRLSAHLAVRDRKRTCCHGFSHFDLHSQNESSVGTAAPNCLPTRKALREIDLREETRS